MRWEKRAEILRRGSFASLLAASALTLGCGGGGVSPVAPTPPPPPPSSVAVSVTPGSGTVLLGNSLAFSASVSGTSDSRVTWTVNGLAGGNAAFGTITAAGLYTAPADLPANTSVELRATSLADTSKSAAAVVTVASDISLGVAPAAASVELGAAQSFAPILTSNGHPDPAVEWSLTGVSCPVACGSLDQSGNYTAPPVMPSAGVQVVVQSVADSSRRAAAAVRITSTFSLTLTAPPSVAAGATAQVTAMLQPVPGSNPSTALNWSLSGPGCAGPACGTLTSEGQSRSANGATTALALYTAPANAPSPANVVITVTPQADAARRAQASVDITSGGGLSIAPATATRALLQRIALRVAAGGSSPDVNWSVNGVAGGSAAAGQICVSGSSPCQPVTSSRAAQVDYLAPAAMPQPNPVTIQAVNAADSSQSATAQVTVIAHVVVSVAPASAGIAPGGMQPFAASVLGTDNQNVVWQVRGAGCAGSGSPCGAIDPNGIYAAPAVAPTPDALQVVAISSEDATQAGSASVAIVTGPAILGLHPASVYAGGAAGFTLRVSGSGFRASSPGPGSTLLVGGAARATNCPTAAECTAAIEPADVASAGNVAISVENPDLSQSNAVALVVADPGGSEEVIPLTPAAPVAAGKDIVVVEPTTAGVSQPGASVDLNVAAIGVFSAANNSCTLAGNPLSVTRPSSGLATFDLCVFSASGLDASMTYTVSGSGDVSVIARQPAGLGIIHLTLQVTSAASAGARTLFISNTNLDKTAASGVLEVR
ncbi:MAG TPA: hypothetical protein VEH49_08960 [Methylomirabilota bacterium]|nr:hypothetical protein [Methylomirabilota bacterium]